MGTSEPLLKDVDNNAYQLSALAARDAIRDGALSATRLAQSCLSRIAGYEETVQAWTLLEPEKVLSQANMLDLHRQSGRPLGALHGLPIGIKDIIDTADMPTENGNAFDTGRQPESDAWIVSRLRAAGAIIAGKTVTTECAYLAPGKTRNPYNPEHTPGGSSSGSAAAVASGMVPLAIGTQTGGSIIRPASYCGVVGFKPSFGMIPRSGVLRTSRRLDTVGVFGRNIEDVALLADVLQGYDAADPDSLNLAPQHLLDTALSKPPVAPQLAFIKTPAWDAIDDDCAAGFAELVEALGDSCDEFELPPLFAEASSAHSRIMHAEIAYNLRHYYDRDPQLLANETRTAIQQGREISTVDYLTALDWRETLYSGLEEVFDRYDAILTPAVAGEAPAGLDSTGSAQFNVMWSLLGTPAITLPVLNGSNGLPIGIQLIGQRYNDGRLLRTARWLAETLANLS